jgi:hypothetical protein
MQQVLANDGIDVYPETLFGAMNTKSFEQIGRWNCTPTEPSIGEKSAGSIFQFDLYLTCQPKNRAGANHSRKVFKLFKTFTQSQKLEVYFYL